MKDVKESSSIGIYLSFRNEVAVEKLIPLLSSIGKNVFAPVVTGTGMKFAQIKSAEDSHAGFNGIREPNSKRLAKNDAIGLFIVPGLAFDLSCLRVGWGQGHYDKFLPVNNNAVTIGVAYDFQIVDKIDAKPHDVKMDFVVTEKRILEY